MPSQLLQFVPVRGVPARATGAPRADDNDTAAEDVARTVEPTADNPPDGVTADEFPGDVAAADRTRSSISPGGTILVFPVHESTRSDLASQSVRSGQSSAPWARRVQAEERSMFDQIGRAHV